MDWTIFDKLIEIPSFMISIYFSMKLIQSYLEICQMSTWGQLMFDEDSLNSNVLDYIFILNTTNSFINITYYFIINAVNPCGSSSQYPSFLWCPLILLSFSLFINRAYIIHVLTYNFFNILVGLVYFEHDFQYIVVIPSPATHIEYPFVWS